MLFRSEGRNATNPYRKSTLRPNKWSIFWEEAGRTSSQQFETSKGRRCRTIGNPKITANPCCFVLKAAMRPTRTENLHSDQINGQFFGKRLAEQAANSLKPRKEGAAGQSEIQKSRPTLVVSFSRPQRDQLWSPHGRSLRIFLRLHQFAAPWPRIQLQLVEA